MRCGAGAGLLLAWRYVGWGWYSRARSNSRKQPMPLDWCKACSMPTRPSASHRRRTWLSIAAGLNPLLREAYDKAEADKDARQELHASLALLPVDATQVDYLYGRLLDAEPHEVPVIRDALAPHKDGLLDKLWAVVGTPEKGKESQRLRAAAALAKYDPESEKWAKVQRPGGQRSGAGKPACTWASGWRRFGP